MEASKEDRNQIAELESQVLEVRAAKIQLLEEIGALKAVRPVGEQLGEATARWRLQLEERDSSLFELQLKNQHLEEEVEDLKREIYALPSQQAYEELLKERNQLEAALALSSASTDSLKQSVASLLKKQEESRDAQDCDTAAVIASLEQDKKALSGRVEELSTQVLSLVSSIPDSSIEVERLKTENIALRRTVQELNMEKIRLIATDSRTDPATAQVEELRSSNSRLEESFRAEASKHSAARDKLIRDKLYLEVELAKANKELESKKAELSALKAADQKEEIEALKRKVQAMESQTVLLETLKQQVTGLETFIEEVTQAHRSFEQITPH